MTIISGIKTLDDIDKMYVDKLNTNSIATYYLPLLRNILAARNPVAVVVVIVTKVPG